MFVGDYLSKVKGYSLIFDEIRENKMIEALSYKQLSLETIQLVNLCKDMETNLLDAMLDMSGDERWKSIAKTHFEQGFMALVKAITK